MDDRDRLSLLGTPVPRRFVLCVTTIAPGGRLAFAAADWDDAMVIVEQGTLDLECTRGGSRRFERGAVLCLAGLPLRALHNLGLEPAVLASVARRQNGTTDDFPHGPESRGTC